MYLTACGQDPDIWLHMHARYLALRRACALSWENWREACILSPAARMEMDNWQDTQSQATDDVETIEGGALPQGGAEADLTRQVRGMCSGWEQEITLVVDDGAIQSESTCRGSNAGTEEKDILSVVSSVDTEVKKEQFSPEYPLCIQTQEWF